MLKHFLFFMSFCLIINLTGNIQAQENNAHKIKLYAPGTEEVVDYDKYGEFKGVGTENYKYIIKDKKGLSQAVGEGIFPNTEILRDPFLQKYRKEGKLKGSRWDFLNSRDLQAAFFVWATAPEEAGVKFFYVATILEKAGLIKEAIKAYYAVIAHFPKSRGYTYWNTPWYPGPTAIDQIEYLTRTHPQLGLKLEGAFIEVKGGFNNDFKDDVFIVNPGKIIKVTQMPAVEEKKDLSKLKIVERKGKGQIELIKYENSHWQLLRNGRPFLIKSIAYSPNKVGLSPDNGTLVVHKDWMLNDFNKNGLIDGPFEAFVDKNLNNIQDEDEKTVGDFALMKEMGTNSIRLYHHGFNKELLKEGYEKYGFMYLIGDYLGMYAVGSGADWYEGTDYTNPEQRQNMLKSVKDMVLEFKDEPYVLMWVLGNENNYGEVGIKGEVPGTGCQAKGQPQAYYEFVNEVARMIKEIDPHHLVAICNGDIVFLDIFAEKCPAVDVFGTNSYRGKKGFGQSLWRNIKELTGKPAFITEYGCPAFASGFTQSQAEDLQAEYLANNWRDIYFNSAGYGEGNALGGVLFEWVDEWWKAGPPPEFNPAKHETGGYDFKTERHLPGNYPGPFPDGWLHEEWLGVTTQGDGSNSPFLRQLRPAYFTLKKLWKGG